MLIKKINDKFFFPIEFDKSKKQIFNNLYGDLELLKTTNDKPSVYQKTFNPSSEIGKECLKKMAKYYTTNTHFLKDTQLIIKKISKNDNLLNNNKIIAECWDSWSNIKNSENFLEKFQYIEWEKLSFLNKSELFILSCLAVPTLFFGFYPDPLINTIEVSISDLIDQYNFEVASKT